MDFTYVAEFLVNHFEKIKPKKEDKVRILKEKLEAVYKQGCIDTKHNIRDSLGINNDSSVIRY